MSLMQVPARRGLGRERWGRGVVLLSVICGQRQEASGTPGASDTVACGPSPSEDKQAMPGLEIIETGFWPVIHYNITARAAPWKLKPRRQDLLGLGLGKRQAGVVWGDPGVSRLPSKEASTHQKMPRPPIDGQWFAHRAPAVCQVLWDTVVTKQTLVPILRELTLA